MNSEFRPRGLIWLTLLLYLGSTGLVFEHAASVTTALPICVTRLLEKDHLLFECQESCGSGEKNAGRAWQRAVAAVGQKQFADRDGVDRAHCSCTCGVCVVATCLYTPAEAAAVSFPLEIHWAHLVLRERRTDIRAEELLRPPRSLF
ncbi:MAG: hypothetical protein WHT09_10665 [Thermogutta sp.]